MTNDGMLLASIVENVSTRRDGTIKLTLGTQEISQGKAGELFTMQNKIVALEKKLLISFSIGGLIGITLGSILFVGLTAIL